jgi:hypothetical protein
MEESTESHFLATSSPGTRPWFQLDRKMGCNQRHSEVMVEGNNSSWVRYCIFVDRVSYIILRHNDVIFF